MFSAFKTKKMSFMPHAMHVKHYKSNMHLSGKGVFVWGKCDSWFRLRMPRG